MKPMATRNADAIKNKHVVGAVFILLAIIVADSIEFGGGTPSKSSCAGECRTIDTIKLRSK